MGSIAAGEGAAGFGRPMDRLTPVWEVFSQWQSYCENEIINEALFYV